jgi:hypothetical protein
MNHGYLLTMSVDVSEQPTTRTCSVNSHLQYLTSSRFTLGFSTLQHRVVLRHSDVSVERIAFILELEKIYSRCQKKQTTCCLLGLIFDPENGGNIFFRNVWLSPNYTMLQLRRHTGKKVKLSVTGRGCP